MPLYALTTRDEIRTAFNTFVDRMVGDKPKLSRTLGFPGGNLQADVYWHEELRFWWTFEDNPEWLNRFWCAFGTENPLDRQGLSITCEINFPFEGINRRVAGVFARDLSGKPYLTHSGKIGGGRKGIGKSLFWSHYQREGIEVVEWPDGLRTKVVVIGEIDTPTIPEHVARFVFAVRDFKGSVQASTGRSARTSPVIDLPAMTDEEVISLKADFSTVKQAAEDLEQHWNLQAPDFNVFIDLDISSKEQIISRFLANLLYPLGSHGQGNLFLEAFLRIPAIGFGVQDISVGTWTVTREKAIYDGRLDIVIENVLTKHLLVIENKIVSGDQENQLLRYRRWLDSQAHFDDDNRRNLIYLTPDGREAQTEANMRSRYERISYQNDITGWLRECMTKIQAPQLLEALKQFLITIESFTRSDVGLPRYKRELSVFLAEPQNFPIAMRIFEVYRHTEDKIFVDFWGKLWGLLHQKLLSEGAVTGWVLSDPPAENEWLNEGAGISIEQQGIGNSECPQLSFRIDHYKDQISYGLMWNPQPPSDTAPIKDLSNWVEQMVSREDFEKGEDENILWKYPHEYELRSPDSLLAMSRDERAIPIAEEFWHFFVTYYQMIAEINSKISSHS